MDPLVHMLYDQLSAAGRDVSTLSESEVLVVKQIADALRRIGRRRLDMRKGRPGSVVYLRESWS